QHRQESADEDRLSAVAVKERPDALERRLIEPDDAPVASHQREAALATDPVAGVVAEDRTGGGRGDDTADVEPAERRERGCRDEDGLGWERDAKALEANDDEEEDVAVRGDEVAERPLHSLAHKHCMMGLSTWLRHLQQVVAGDERSVG